MRRFRNVVRLLGAAVVLCVLAACGGIGDVGSSSENAQAGDGGTKAPTIEGTPRSTVAVGRTYSFQPAVSNANGGSLTFTARNLPEWLTIDAASGRLMGTPAEGDIGTYSGITISVTDGVSNSVIGPFTITVIAQGDGTASLTWTPPTTNADGSALRDLAGFVILFGYSPDELTETITINDPSVSTYVVDSLTSGTWYFAVQAMNTGGARSESSSVASKTI